MTRSSVNFKNNNTKFANTTTRSMGGAQPESQSMKAKLFGGHKPEEGWQEITAFTYGGAIILLFMVANAPDTSITTWANAEARARLELKASGKVEKLEFGTHYNVDENKYDFDSLKPDDPFDEDVEEEDDDDDEDEDDEE